MLQGFKRVAFFGAHTDDEMICAGTLRRLVRLGAEVEVNTFGPAAVRKDRLGGPESSHVVGPEWNRALDLIGVASYARRYYGYMPSSELPSFAQQIAQAVYDYCEARQPDCLITLSPEDENPAH